MLNQRLALTALLAMAVIGAAAALADDFGLNWWTVDAGGQMWSIGGGFELSGTVGQPDAGAMTGGGFELTGGFWVSGVAGPAVCPGDTNCDGRVNFADIDPFVALLGSN